MKPGFMVGRRPRVSSPAMVVLRHQILFRALHAGRFLSLVAAVVDLRCGVRLYRRFTEERVDS